MMTLYTAIGTYKLNTHGLPTVISGDKEYGLSARAASMDLSFLPDSDLPGTACRVL